MKVVVAGAGGLLGRALRQAFQASGAEVLRLVRRPPHGPGEAAWDPAGGRLDPTVLAGADAIVHLGGENIAAGRWTRRRRERILRSRVDSTRLLVQGLTAAAAAGDLEATAVFLCASATGYYGDRGDEELDETSPPGAGFLARTCVAWEEAAAGAEAAGIRTVRLRFGVVLDPAGGALARMLPPFRLGLGGPLGSGRQWLPWLTCADAVAAVRWALARAELSGPVNAVAGTVRNRDFARALGRALGRPAVLPAPAPLLRLVLGAMADELLLGGQRARPRALLASGWRPVDAGLEEALDRILGRAGRLRESR
ncbi:MAG: TIGR01777 family protein [Planctomycetota bacterium]|nr:MAG: TIGR01777 family protein [Planctomycetota bacterium]